MMTTRLRSRRVMVSVGVVLVVVIGSTAWWTSQNGGSDSTVVTTTTSSTHSSERLSTPTATAGQDGQFLADITEADPALTTYEKKSGNVALRSLLTDGSAFCAFLQRDGSLDDAMVDVAVGARSVESKTHLPLSVTTFNSIDSVAILTLCPSLHTLVPASVMAKIRNLKDSLAQGAK
jgi:hypothetical protein